jgi:PAS domain S-box-containing protein
MVDLEDLMLGEGVPPGIAKRIINKLEGDPIAHKPLDLCGFSLNLDELAIPIYVTNGEGEILWLNDAMVDLFGYSKEELLTINVASLYVDPQKRDDLIAELKETGSVKEYEAALRTKSGDRQCKITSSIVYGESGPVFQGTIRDITYKRMANEQRRIADKLRAAQTVRDRLMHDLNNALGGMKGNAQFAITELQGFEPNIELLSRYVFAIDRATDRLIVGVESVRGVVSEEIAKELDLNKIVSELISMSAPNPRLNGYVIQTDLNADIPIYGIKSELYRVIENLIMNAAESMSNDSNIVINTNNVQLSNDYYHKIRIPKGSYVKLSVQDSGCGMTAETLKRVLNDGRYSTKRDNGGYGVFNVKGIVTSYGGYMVVTSELNKGTTVDIYLPAMAERNISEIETTPPIQVLDYFALGFNPSEKSILVVEDEDAIRELVNVQLSGCGYNVDLASCAFDGAEMFLEKLVSGVCYDLVLTDINMPGELVPGGTSNEEAGRDLARFVLDKCRDTKIILMSGYRGQTMDMQSNVNVSNILYKPFNISDLEITVGNVISNRNT